MNSPDALWDMFLLNGVMFFVTCFFITQKRREKGEDLELLHFSVVSLLFILTFTSCLSSLYHPNVLRSKLNASPFHCLHSGFAAESTVQHISLMAGEIRYWETKSLITFFRVVLFFFPLLLLWLSNVVSLLTTRIYKWEAYWPIEACPY